MQEPLKKFYAYLEQPLFNKARVVLALLVIPLILAFSAPLWRIQLHAPQYPEGLYMDVFAYKLEGGNGGQHLQEINTLNHYIGMRPIDRAALSDLDWIPFALGALVLMTLRVAAVGNVRGLVDLTVVSGYIALFSFGRFAYKLYVFGHNLAPDAPVKIKPFMPVVLGSKQIANFTATSFPLLGSLYMGVFIAGVLALCTWQLFAGRRAAARA